MSEMHTPTDYAIEILKGVLHLKSSNDEYRMIKKKVLQDTIAAMESLRKAQKALSLARSMILSGEKMSDSASAIFSDALRS